MHTTLRYFEPVDPGEGTTRAIVVDLQVFDGAPEPIGLLHVEQVDHLARHARLDLAEFDACAQDA